ncbi:MAG: type I restriction-modification enzyme R subunit C-terminal domain-containing protein [Bacteroidota bacterium]
MASGLRNENADLVAANPLYIMQITGDNEDGKRELGNFTDPEEPYPVIATTSELMTTGIDAQTCKVIVLDSEIKSMTKFKQIIGRGTRINEDYNKRYFTILDFRNVTDLFADKAFDGDPIRIKPVGQDVDLSGIIDEEESENAPPPYDENGEEIDFGPTISEPPPIQPPPPPPRVKIIVNGIDVSVLVSREMPIDQNGKLVMVNLRDYTKAIITGQYASLSDFLTRWNSADRKDALIIELEKQGVFVDQLLDAVDREVDLFDLICHIAYDQPPLTRKERANNVKKRHYFAKYGEQTRKVLETLLDKYADEGIVNIENIEVLRVKPFDVLGSPTEIIQIFGSKEIFLQALKELEVELYKIAN